MNKISKIGSYIFLTFASIISVFPFLWMIIGATNASVDVTKGKLTFGQDFVSNIQRLFETTDIEIAIVNSLSIALLTTIIAILVSSAAGYGFVIYKSRVKEKIFSILLLSMMIPFAAIMIPLYKMFGQFGLLNTYMAVVLPSVATAFLIFFFRQNLFFN